MQPRRSSWSSTEDLLAEAQRLCSVLIGASARLGAFTEMLRELLDALPPEETDAHGAT